MEAISTAAKRAAEQEQERRFSAGDLESKTGATVGNAYLVSQGDDEPDFVMVVTGIGHYNDDYRFTNEDIWRQPAGVDTDEFLSGVYVEAEFYRIQSFLGGGVLAIHEDPFETPRIPRAALSEFPRKQLDEAAQDGTFALPM